MPYEVAYEREKWEKWVTAESLAVGKMMTTMANLRVQGRRDPAESRHQSAESGPKRWSAGHLGQPGGKSMPTGYAEIWPAARREQALAGKHRPCRYGT